METITLVAHSSDTSFARLNMKGVCSSVVQHIEAVCVKILFRTVSGGGNVSA